MSLINQVLKDLEKRHASVGEVRGEARAVRPLPEDVSRRGFWIALGLIGATAVGGGAWWFLRYPDPTAVLSMRSAKIAADLPTIAPAAVAASAALPPVAVNPSTAAAAVATQTATTSAGATSTNAAVPSPTSARENIGLLQLAPNPMPAGPATTLAPKSEPSAPRAQAPAVGVTESPAGQSATLAPKPADKPARNAKPKGSDPPAKVGLSGTHPGEHPARGGLEPASNIAKQVRPPSERERAEVPFREGMAALQAGDAVEGEDRLRAALAIDPLADKARQALLGLYMQRGRREDAERLLEDRLRLDRNHAGFAMALARLQLEHDANSDALVTLQRSLSYGEASSDYQAILANALGRVGRHREAAERFEAATRLAPHNPLWLMGLGVELRYDRPEEARAAFQRARELGGLTPQLVAFVDQQLRELK